MTRSRARIVAAALVLLAACSGGTPTGTTPPAVATVTVSLAASTLTIGDSTHATAVTADSLGTTLTGRAITWSSSNAAVATVSTTGLVIAVSAGTASISATSGGKTGQASITVNPPGPQLSGITVADANGHPVNLNSVGGTLMVSAQLQVPATTTGTLVVLIDTTVFAQQPVTASRLAPVHADGASLMGASSVQVEINTAMVGYTVNQEAITALPLARNGSHMLGIEFLVPGSSQPVASEQVAMTTANPDIFAAATMRSGSLTTLDGVPWSSGDLTVQFIPIQFSSNAPQLINAEYADFLADFHGATPTGVAPVASRTGSNIVSPTVLSHTTFQFESKPSLGWNLILTNYAFGTTQYAPQTAEPNNGGNCVYTRGTGLLQPTTVVPPVTLPAGCSRWVLVTPIPPSLLGTGEIDGSNVIYHDTKGPTIAPSAWTLATSPQIAGQSAYGSWGGFGVANNYIGWTYQFASGVDLTKIVDLGSGLDLTRSFDLYTGTTPGFTPGPSNLLTDLTTLSPTGASRSRYFTGAWYDRLGNSSYAPLTTNAGNPYTTGNLLSTHFGIDPALVGINNTGGTATYSGLPDRFAWRTSDVSSLSLTWALTGSPVGYASNGAIWSRFYKDLDPTRTVYGEGTNTTVPWFWSGTGGASVNYSLPFAALVNNAKTRYGGDGEGVYTGYMGAVDLSGAVPVGGEGTTPYRFVYDVAAPSLPVISSTSTFTPGAAATFHLTGTDNVGLGKYAAGWRFNYSNALFELGQVYTAFDHDVGTLSGTALVPSLGVDDVQTMPRGFVFFDPNLGTIQAPVYNTNGFTARTWDLAGNASALGTLAITNDGTYPLPASPTAIRYTVSGTSFCAGTACTNGSQNIMTVQASWDSPTSVNPLSKFDLYLLTPVGVVQSLKTGPAPVTSTIAGGYRFTSNITVDWSKGCQPTGTVYLYGLAETTDQLYFFKPNVFTQLTIFVQPTLVNCELSPEH